LDSNQKSSCDRETKLQTDKKGVSGSHSEAISACAAERAQLADTYIQFLRCCFSFMLFSCLEIDLLWSSKLSKHRLTKLRTEEEDLHNQIAIVQKRMLEVDAQIRDVDRREEGIMEEFSKQDRQFQRNMQKEADVQVF
jgi:hypothetical protein